MKRSQLLEKVKKAILEIEPDADVIMYGSRSRGDAVSESDWDFLVLVDGIVNDERIDRIRHRLYEIELDSGTVISSIVRNREQWNSPQYKAMPLHKNVDLEGIVL